MSDLSNYIKEIEASIDIVELAKSIGIDVDRQGRCKCLVHAETDPSLVLKNGFGHCWGCRAHFFPLQLIQAKTGESFRDALNRLADFAGRPHFGLKSHDDAELHAYMAKLEQKKRVNQLLEAAAEKYAASPSQYLISRGISAETCAKYGCGDGRGKDFLRDAMVNNGFDQTEIAPLLLNKYGHDLFQNGAVIPIRSAGRVVNLYARSTEKDCPKEFKHRYLPLAGFKAMGGEPETTLFNRDETLRCQEVNLFESIIDCLSAISNGIENSLAIYGTQGLKPEHIAQLRRSKVRLVTLVLDNDAAGHAASIKIGTELDKNGIPVNIVSLPAERGKDMNEYFLRGGNAQEFKDLPRRSLLQYQVSKITAANPVERAEKLVPVLKTIAHHDGLVLESELQEIKVVSGLSITAIRKQVQSIKEDAAQEKKAPLKIVRGNETQTESGTEDDPESVKASIKDAPGGDLICPYDYEMASDGIFRITEDGSRMVFPCPVLITEAYKDIISGNELVCLAWKRRNCWHDAIVSREVIADSKKIVVLSSAGFPVNSLNAKSLICFLGAFETANIDRLPLIKFSSVMGLQEGLGFIYDEFLPLPGVTEKVIFKGKDDGDDQVAKAIRRVGSFEKWLQVVYEVRKYPKIMFGLYTSLAAPLVSIFGLPNFVMNYSCQTSGGKSSGLMLAASVWGQPEKERPNSFVHSWNATAVSIERICTVLNNLPVIFDDTKDAKSPEFIAQTIYTFVSGRSKERGSIKGKQASYTWNTIFLTSGEQRITSFSQDGGTRTRVLELWGAPLHDDIKEGSRLAHLIKDVVRENYGHAGQRWIRYIIDHQAEWPNWRETFCQGKAALRSREPGRCKKCRGKPDECNECEVNKATPFADRIAEYGALIIYVEHSFRTVFPEVAGWDWQIIPKITDLWDKIVDEANEADRASVALRLVYDWAVGHQQSFFERHGDVIPYGGFLGKWQRDKKDEWGNEIKWDHISFLFGPLSDFLETKGFRASDIIRTWRDRGYFYGNDEKYPREYIGGIQHRVIAIKRSVVDI
jgi:DNA primase catalytic core